MAKAIEPPAPLVNADVELRDFAFMPLDIHRLRRSKAWLICKRRPELAFYMLNLWTAAWHDTPAASLEDDDDVLADLAMCPPREWPKVRDDVLRGWVKCSDGRLYHPVVAEKAKEAWQSKALHAYDRECGRLRKAATRAGVKNFVPPTFEEWSASRVSAGQTQLSSGPTNVSNGHIKDNAGTSQGIPPENALKGQGQGQGQGQGYIYTGTACPADTTGTRPCEMSESEHHERFERVQAIYPKPLNPVNWIHVEKACRERIDEGATWDELEASAERVARFVKSGGRSSSQYVHSPLKHFSTDSLWRAAWDPPPPKRSTREQQQDANVDATLEWLREQEAKDAAG